MKMLLTTCVFMFMCVHISKSLIFDDPCDVRPVYTDDVIPNIDNYTSEIQVPQSCLNGSLYWDYPRGHVILHFQNPDKESLSVCLRDFVGGSAFNITDITVGAEEIMISGLDYDTWVCTETSQEKELVLKVDAPWMLRYVGAVEFKIKISE